MKPGRRLDRRRGRRSARRRGRAQHRRRLARRHRAGPDRGCSAVETCVSARTVGARRARPGHLRRACRGGRVPTRDLRRIRGIDAAPCRSRPGGPRGGDTGECLDVHGESLLKAMVHAASSAAAPVQGTIDSHRRLSVVSVVARGRDASPTPWPASPARRCAPQGGRRLRRVHRRVTSRAMASGSEATSRTRMRPPHLRQRVTSIAKTRARRLDQPMRRGLGEASVADPGLGSVNGSASWGPGSSAWDFGMMRARNR